MNVAPEDPFKELHHDDACVAVGVAALDVLAEGSAFAIVIPDGEGGFIVSGDDNE